MRLKKAVVPILVAIAAVVGTVGLSFVGQHHSSKNLSPAAAATEFDRFRARFAGTPPLVDMTQRHSSVQPRGEAVAGRVHVIHTLVFDTRGGDRLVEVSAPYWLAKALMRSGQLHWLGELTFLDDTEFDPERIELSLDQIAERGPGPIVDFRHPSGGQFFSWAD